MFIHNLNIYYHSQFQLICSDLFVFEAGTADPSRAAEVTHGFFGRVRVAQFLCRSIMRLYVLVSVL